MNGYTSLWVGDPLILIVVPWVRYILLSVLYNTDIQSIIIIVGLNVGLQAFAAARREIPATSSHTLRGYLNISFFDKCTRCEMFLAMNDEVRIRIFMYY